MGLKEFEHALELIRAHSDLVDFSGPKDKKLIESAERALGLRFPPSYRAFLKKLGCGGVAGEEFYGVVDENFYDSGIPDGIWETLSRREKFGFPQHLIIIATTGFGPDYVLDSSSPGPDGEYPVVLWNFDRVEEVVADSFGSFFLEQIKKALKNFPA